MNNPSARRRGSIHRFLSRLFLRRKPSAHEIDKQAIERIVGASITDLGLYARALRHRSTLRDHPKSHLESNERLEFLGDAVLGVVVAELLFKRYPEEDEGFLTRMRAKLVNGRSLANYAEATGLNALILMSENMEQAQGRQNRTILADAFEALIGAIYLDLGYRNAEQFILRVLGDHVNLKKVAQRTDNYKSVLLEYAQAQGWPQPVYRVVHEEGPNHAKQFTVEVEVNGEIYGPGTAGNKKAAEQLAASRALRTLRV